MIKVKHQHGSKERWYGKLGETLKETQIIDSFNAVETFTTQYAYDSWGRLHQLTYPDGEVLTYTYDAGGNVNHAEGVKQQDRFVYLKRLDYDKFGQRVFLELGNGVTTNYQYDAKTRRLAVLKTQSKLNQLQNLTYAYDKVGNMTHRDVLMSREAGCRERPSRWTTTCLSRAAPAPWAARSNRPLVMTNCIA
ncbi:MAG: hypothetical protein OEZ39_20200 [Gammaproteobacteria bacterium]|nr:hypothetical protein [Gammaproteobacteria bacterium]